MNSGLARWVIAVVVAFLLLCPHLRMYTEPATRYFAFWGKGDAIAVGAGIILLGTIIFVLHNLARRLELRWLNRVMGATFVAVVGLAIIVYLKTDASLGEYFGGGTTPLVLTGLVCLLATACLTKKFEGAERICRNFCLILSPMVPLVLLQLLAHPEFSIAKESLPDSVKMTAAKKADAGNVYLIIFDEWSFARTFGGLNVEEELPNLARFIGRSTFYHDAHSPHRSTEQSLPSILFQTSDVYVHDSEGIGFQSEAGEFIPAQSMGSLFSDLKDVGYQTYLVGWYHPYRRMFSDELDYCWSTPALGGIGHLHGLVEKMGGHLWVGLEKSTVAIPKPAALQWRLQQFWGLDGPGHLIEATTTIHQLALSIIGEQAEPTVAVFHYTVPHWPFIYNRQGLNLKASQEMPLHFGKNPVTSSTAPSPKHYVARYVDNMRYMDTLLGELVTAMESADRFERSTIILTSDHSWRTDPDIGDAPEKGRDTHVPLIVKHPNQTVAREVYPPFKLTDLRGLIPALQSPEFTTSELAATLEPDVRFQGTGDRATGLSYP